MAVLLFFSGACAWAGTLDLITQRAWVEDPTGQLSLAQVQQLPTQSIDKGDFNQGYSASAFWLRLRIDPSLLPPDHPDQRLVMRIQSPNLDDLRLFDPLQTGPQPQIAGDLHPQLDNGLRSLNFNFVLPRGQSPRDLWLRITTTSSTLTKLQVVSESEARALDHAQTLGSMAYIAVLVICLGWAVVAWQLLRDRLILFYVARELVAIAYAMVVLGGLQLFAWGSLLPAWIDGYANFIACATGAVLIWFDIQLMSPYRPHWAALAVLRISVALCALAALLTLLGFTPLAFKINSWVVMSMPLTLLVAAVSTRAWSDGQGNSTLNIPRWALLSFYALFPLLLLLNRGVLVGWLPPLVIASHTALAYLLIGSIAMMVILQLRASRIYKQQQETQLRLRVAEKTAEDERERREAQERFLAMLGHELRNPLAAVGLLADTNTEDGRHIRSAVNDMTQVLERSLQSSRLADGRFVPALEAIDMPALVQGICQRSTRIALSNFAPGTTALSDRMCLQIVLSNLVDNALKYSPPESPVWVTCSLPDASASLQIEVSNWPGVAGLPDVDRVFQKYYRSPQAHHQIGAGLGLYLSQSLAELLQGRIRCVQPLDRQRPRVVFLFEIPTNVERV